jgi:hypothetical protein
MGYDNTTNQAVDERNRVGRVSELFSSVYHYLHYVLTAVSPVSREVEDVSDD